MIVLILSSAIAFPLMAAPVGTIPPANLLKSLPPVPADWKCRQSLGKAGIFRPGYPQTSVIRQYEVPPKVDMLSPVVPALPAIFSIAVLDLGSQGNSNESPRIATKTEEPFPLAPFIASNLQQRENEMSFSGAIGFRLYLRITAQNILASDFKKILKSLDFSMLAVTEKQLPSVPLDEVKFQEKANGSFRRMKTIQLLNIYFDELNPSVQSELGVYPCAAHAVDLHPKYNVLPCVQRNRLSLKVRY